MALELLEKVRAAEGEAARIMSEAQSQAREMLKAVEEACLNREREENAGLRQMYQNEIERRRADIAAEISEKTRGDRTEREKLLKAGREHIPDAAAMIFERITE